MDFVVNLNLKSGSVDMSFTMSFTICLLPYKKKVKEAQGHLSFPH